MAFINKLSEQDEKFVLSKTHDWVTVSVGYVRNMDEVAMREYESFYQRNLDPSFQLGRRCRDCVLKMMERLYASYQQWLEQRVPEIIKEKDEVKPKKDGGTKRK